MTWFVIIVLAVVFVATVLAIVCLAAFLAQRGSAQAEAARIDYEARSAERRLHEIARSAFAAMLDEARARSHGGVR
jgi:NADH:ubiquinone oxidoreductase subunit 3 (subunit A)